MLLLKASAVDGLRPELALRLRLLSGKGPFLSVEKTIPGLSEAVLTSNDGKRRRMEKGPLAPTPLATIPAPNNTDAETKDGLRPASLVLRKHTTFLRRLYTRPAGPLDAGPAKADAVRKLAALLPLPADAGVHKVSLDLRLNVVRPPVAARPRPGQYRTASSGLVIHASRHKLLPVETVLGVAAAILRRPGHKA